MAQTKDMTSGKPAGLIFFFALPLMLGNIFQQLYIVVDTAVVGQVAGVEALAALGAAEWAGWRDCHRLYPRVFHPDCPALRGRRRRGAAAIGGAFADDDRRDYGADDHCRAADHPADFAADEHAGQYHWRRGTLSAGNHFLLGY